MRKRVLLNRYKDAIAEEAARALSGDSGANEAIVKRYGELLTEYCEKGKIK